MERLHAPISVVIWLSPLSNFRSSFMKTLLRNVNFLIIKWKKMNKLSIFNREFKSLRVFSKKSEKQDHKIWKQKSQIVKEKIGEEYGMKSLSIK